MRASKTVTTVASDLFTQATPAGQANSLSVTIQNPATNAAAIEIAWDDPDTTLVAGTGQILVPGDWRTIRPLPANSSGLVRVQAIAALSVSNIRVMVSATGGAL
jgi:hypothetical protein